MVDINQLKNQDIVLYTPFNVGEDTDKITVGINPGKVPVATPVDPLVLSIDLPKGMTLSEGISTGEEYSQINDSVRSIFGTETFEAGTSKLEKQFYLNRDESFSGGEVVITLKADGEIIDESTIEAF